MREVGLGLNRPMVGLLAKAAEEWTYAFQCYAQRRTPAKTTAIKPRSNRTNIHPNIRKFSSARPRDVDPDQQASDECPPEHQREIL